MKKVNTKIFFVAIFSINDFFFDARHDFHVFLDFNVNENFSKLARLTVQRGDFGHKIRHYYGR